MRPYSRFSLFVVLMAVAVIAAPDFSLAGCGGGRHRGGHHGGDGNGGGHRGHHNGNDDDDDNDNDGPRHHGHRGRGGVDVGIGIGPGYGRGLIGPPTQACAELYRMRTDLARLFNLRTQINSGKRVIDTTDSGRHVVVRARDYRNDIAVTMSPSSGTNNGDAQQLANLNGAMAQARDDSLAIIDSQIMATQTRISQLEYDCQE